MSNRSNTDLRDLMTQDLVMLPASASIFEAAAVMLDKNVGDVLVEEEDKGRPVGIVSLGDLAIDRERRSTLGEISAASPSH